MLFASSLAACCLLSRYSIGEILSIGEICMVHVLPNLQYGRESHEDPIRFLVILFFQSQ